MWKRMQQNRTGRPPAIGEPLLLETTLDENAYGPSQRNLREIGSPSPDSAMRPERSQRSRDGPPNLPSSLRSHPYTGPTGRAPYMPSTPQNKSSRPWAEMAARTYGENVEISPPSSPDIKAPASGRRPYPNYDVEISPVDEIPDVSTLRLNRPEQTSRPRHQPASNIPILRREKRRNNLMAKSDMREQRSKTRSKSDTRWDTLTGEPTTSDRGRLQQVKPSEFVAPSTDSGSSRPTLRRARPASKLHAPFGERARNLREIITADRPEWRGASGRETIVPPMADQLEIPPLNLPRRRPKGSESLPVDEPRTTDARSVPVSAVEAGVGETAVASSTTTPGTPVATVQSSSRGQDALHSSRPSMSTVSQGRPANNYMTKPLPMPSLDDPPRTPENPGSLGKRDDTISTIENNFTKALKGINIPTPMKEQPVSRFSISTYATTTVDSTPRVSIDQSPSVPSPTPSPLNQPSPFVNRTRPKAGDSFDTGKATARKAVPNPPVVINMSSPSQPRRNTKTLPKSPAEAASVDLVSSLQAQRDNLAHRRRNLDRCIQQMTKLMPVDILARGMEAQRQAAERKKVELLKEDLAEVMREEHELGLRLHRAYKRMEQDAVYEPTTLWIRRVTG